MVKYLCVSGSSKEFARMCNVNYAAGYASGLLDAENTIPRVVKEPLPGANRREFIRHFFCFVFTMS